MARMGYYTRRGSIISLLHSTKMGWTTKMLMVIQLAVVTGWTFEAAQAILETTPYACNYTNTPAAYNADGSVANCTWCSYIDTSLNDTQINACISDTWAYVDNVTSPAPSFDYVEDAFDDGAPACMISCNSSSTFAPAPAPAPTGSAPPASQMQSPPAPPPPVCTPIPSVKRKSTNVGLIVGAVVGGILACQLAGVLIWLVSKKNNVATATPKDTNGDASGNHFSNPPPMPRTDLQQGG